MKVIHQLSKDIILPKMLRVRQYFNSDSIDIKDIPALVSDQLGQMAFSKRIKKDARIAISCGSRGIANIDLITKSIVNYCKDIGAKPFVVPAMGSHGGANAEGQRAILAQLGVTEDFLGCPILSSMDTVCLGQNEEGVDVHIDKYAYQSDGIIVCGRIKPHTDFRGRYESGLMKMMAIGLGKQYGAEITHNDGFPNMAKNILLFGRTIIKNAPILCGLGIIENPYGQTYLIRAVEAKDIEKEEPKLLDIARENMAKIYFDNIDLLIVDEIGKNYSGAGMDPNVTGRFADPNLEGGINAKNLVVLDLSEESEGNASGVDLADLTTKKLIDKCNFDSLYVNSITANYLAGGKIPMVADNDEDCIKIVLRTLIRGDDAKDTRIVRIANTAQLGEILISQTLVEEARENPNVEIISQVEDFKFNNDRDLVPLFV